MEIIALYPGQGSQQRGMGLSLYEASERVRTLFKEVSEIAERDMYTLLSEGSDGDLTTYAQLVITLVNRSAHLRLSELGTTIRVHAGFSLGELSAYAAASILDDATLFQIILTRMAMMETLSAKARDTHGELVMAAAIGLDYPAIEAVLEGERITDLWPANDNAPLQVVLSGTRSGLERARQPLFQAGVRRLIPLKVSGPFHTPFMEEATAPFARYLEGLPFSEPKEPVYSSIDGHLVKTAHQARANLASQLARPVRWTQLMRELAVHTTPFAEVGHGTVLCGLCKSNNIPWACVSLSSEEAIAHALKDTP